ncbi:MAG: hypothetical protein QOG23_4628 [Blastocatellia bacterium]|jgi:hypothetical protein|nr:hypothetical protein [Blastocatellia bacterium]
MKKAINLVASCVLVLLVGNFAQGQKRSTKGTTSKQSAAAPRIICKGQTVPKGFVVVGYKSSVKCGSDSELVIKKPAETEIVCDSSPIPEGYHIVSQEGSRACATTNSNPLTNALSILRDGSSALPQTVAARGKDLIPLPSRYDPNAVVQQRAAEEQKKTEIELAALHHQIMVGMTTNQLLSSWGRPSDVLIVTSHGSTTWVYTKGDGSVHVHFDNGILRDWAFFPR